MVTMVPANDCKPCCVSVWNVILRIKLSMFTPLYERAQPLVYPVEHQGGHGEHHLDAGARGVGSAEGVAPGQGPFGREAGLPVGKNDT